MFVIIYFDCTGYFLMKRNYSTNWVFQKVYAVIFLLLCVYTSISITQINLKNYAEVIQWFKNYKNSFLFFILIASVILHSNIGLSSIIDDYIHNQKNKKIILILKNFFLVTIFSIIAISLLSILNIL